MKFSSSNRTTNRISMIGLTIVLLVSMLACNLPFAKPTPVVEEVPTATPVPTEVKKPDLPPTILETNPLPESVIPVKGGIQFTFNQAMERQSVEGALQVEPSVGGKFEWKDDLRVVFTPDQALPTAANVSFTFNNTVRAANGLAMQEPVSFDFQTAEILRLTQYLPAGEEIDPTSAVVAVFNQPVVPLGANPDSLPVGFTIEPEAGGRGEWLNTSTYIYYPDPAFEGGKTYTVRINNALVSTAGTTFGEGEISEWSFGTATPRILDVQPTGENRIRLDDKLIIKFNQPMDQEITQEAISMTGDGGTRVSGAYQWNDNGTELTFTPDNLLTRNAAHYLRIDPSAAGAGGTLLQNPQQIGYVTVPELALDESNTEFGQVIETYGGFGSISLSFTSPLKRIQDFNQIISFTPEVDGLNVSCYDNNMYISGYFAPSTDYSVAISTSLVDEWEGPLVEPVVYEFSTAPFPAAIIVPMNRVGGSILMITPWDNRIPAEVNNVQRIYGTRAGLSVEDFIIAAGYLDMLDVFEIDDRWSQNVGGNLNEKQDIDLRVISVGNEIQTGLYAFAYTAPEITEAYNSAKFYAIVSRVQLTVKKSSNQVFVWAVNLEDLTPIADLPIVIYDSVYQVIGEATTDADGRAVYTSSSILDIDEQYYVVSGQPGDEYFGMVRTNMDYGISPWQMGILTEYDNPQIQAYLYSDRPIYRPGQTLYLRGLLSYPQNGRYSLPFDAVEPITQVDLKIFGYASDGSESGWQQEVTLPLSDFGTFTTEIQLPESLSPGYYYAEVTNLVVPKSLGFQVAEYRKPEIDLQVETNSTEILAGSPVEFITQANYYFGVPAANQSVSWSLYVQPSGFYLPGYQTGKINWDWWVGMRTLYITSGAGTTDGQGAFSLEVDEELYRSTVDLDVTNRLILEVTVLDSSGFPVSARAEVIRHPSSFYVGLRSDSWNGTAGEELGFDVWTVDWQKKGSGNHNLTANLLKVSWVEGAINYETGEVKYNRETALIDSTEIVVDASAKARVDFTAADPGVYVVEVVGENAYTEYQFWVSGSGVAAWPRLPDDRLELKADAESYRPGENAVINIPNPFPGEALALVTVERGSVVRSEVIRIQDAAYLYTLPVIADDAPNIYLGVVLISSQADTQSEFRYGMINIEVDPAALLLQVELTPQPGKVGPGENVTYQLRVTDSSGKPVEGEFSLAIVDKALLALADPNSNKIEDFYYGNQKLGVRTSLTLAVHANRIDTTPVAFGRGGGGGDGMPVQSGVREDFRDTAFWEGTVITNSDGVAEIIVPMPDNLTTWVADVRGLTRDMRVGSGTAEVIVSKPLLVRPVTPRFVVTGDHVELAVVIHNNTTDLLEVQVGLQSSGFTLDDPAVQAQTISLNSGDQIRVNWWGTVEAVEELDLVFNAQGGGYSDSTRPVWGKLPVRHYSAPQTFATSGVLPQAGQRLEIVSIPMDYTPLGGTLGIEMTPSLTALILGELEVLDASPYDYSETILSRLLPNIETYRILKEAGMDMPDLENQLLAAVQDGVDRLIKMQNADGGWGWMQGEDSQIWLSAYVTFGLARASQAGFSIPDAALTNGQNYLKSVYPMITDQSANDQINDAAFIRLALSESGADVDPMLLWPFYERMSPSAQAMQALVMSRNNAAEENLRTLIQNLQAGAVRSATGVFWDEPENTGWSRHSANYSTAVVVYALSQIDPASTLLPDAARYLVSHRKALGGWGSTYESAWIIMGLGQYMLGTGDLRPAYAYNASLNGTQVLSGSASSSEIAVPVSTEIPLGSLFPQDPNGLLFERTSGNGSLFYRAYLQVDRPIEDAQPVNRGVTLDRQYFLYDQDCKMPDCTPVSEISLGAENNQVLTRITITLPHDMYYLVVEDFIPAGMEVVDLSLNTTEQGNEYTTHNLFERGWGWWRFRGPRIYDEKVHWSSSYLSAGTYELTYRMIPITSGEFRALPAHAWEYYFPEVEGSSAGAIFTVTP